MASAPNPAYRRREVIQMLPIWRQIRDCIDGETAIKGIYHPGRLPSSGLDGSSGFGVTTVGNDVVSDYGASITTYLPKPNADDQDPANQARYRSYVERAQFYPVTSRTLDGLTGQIFQRDPEVNLPEAMKVMEKDCDGSGLTMLQVAQKAVNSTLAYGRMGILADYPAVTKPASKADLATGQIRPTLLHYEAWNIANWSTLQRGALRVLSMVVLREPVDVPSEDGFELEHQEQYRVLRLTQDFVYTVEIWSKSNEGDSGAWSVGPTKTPLDADGKTLDFIPFKFVGSESNDWFIDKPPMADIASLNVGHYRNSADYEESVFLCGQPTLVITGLEQSWVDKNFKDKQVRIGSRHPLMLGVNSTAELLQAEANMLALEAMKHKEEQMMAIGAKLITQNKTTRTATETTVQQSSENSTLGNIAVNVGAAMEECLVWCAGFLGIAIQEQQTTAVDTEDDKKSEDNNIIKYTLNSDFDLQKKTPQEIAQIIANWQSGGTSWTEMRVSLRAAGYTSQPDDEAKAEIVNEKAQAFQLGGHTIADPFDQLPPGTAVPAPMPTPDSPAGKVAQAAIDAKAKPAIPGKNGKSKSQAGNQTKTKK